MIEGRQDLRLPREPGQAVRVRREGVGQDLQRDLAVELGVGGLPDLAHAAFPEEGGHVVVAEADAGAEGHDVSTLLIATFYAEAVHGSSVRHCVAAKGARMRVLGGSIGLDGPQHRRVCATGVGRDGPMPTPTARARRAGLH